MPDRLAPDLVLLLRQNRGRLPKRHRRREFRVLSDDEVALMEQIVREEFEGFDSERYALLH